MVLLVGLWLAGCSGRARVPTDAALPPSAAAVIQHAFESMAPVLRYTSIGIDHHTVQATVCPAAAPDSQCFPVRLSAPVETCAGRIEGPFCVVYPQPPPPGAIEAMTKAFEAIEVGAVWSAPEQKTVAEPLRVRLLKQARTILLLAFVVLGLGTWGYARRRARLPLLLELSLTVVVGVLAFIAVEVQNSRPDTTNAIFLYVTECLLFGDCHTVGPGSSVVLNNGTIWEAILMSVRLNGGSAQGVYHLVMVTYAVGVALTVPFASRFLSPVLGIPAALVALALLTWQPVAAPLLDSSGTFLFAAGSALCLLVYTNTTRRLPLMLSAALAAHAFQSHVSGVTLLPALLVVPLLVGPAGSRALLVTWAAFLISACATSLQAVVGNLDVIHTAGLLKWVGTAVVLLAFAAYRLRGWFVGLSPVGQLGVTSLCLVGPYAGGVTLLKLIHHPVLAGYLPPTVVPAAVGLVLLLAWVSARLAPRSTLLRFALPMLAGVLLFAAPGHTVVGAATISEGR